MSQKMNLTENELKEIQELSKRVRCNIVKMVSGSKSGHPGGSLSCADIISTLYSACMKHYPEWDKHPQWNNRDRFVLAKGHSSPALYSILAELGYIKKEDLSTFRKINSKLQGHPAYGYIPGVEASTGSLGQGLSVCCGIALGLRLDKKPENVFTILGDGEMQEGQVWEAAMTAAHYGLGNLIAFIDRNRLQIDGCTENVMGLDPVDKKWAAFGWNVLQINGHDHQEIFEAVQKAKEHGAQNSQPTVIIANTVKGKGVSYMENNAGWHGKPPSEEECQIALKELGGE